MRKTVQLAIEALIEIVNCGDDVVGFSPEVKIFFLKRLATALNETSDECIADRLRSTFDEAGHSLNEQFLRALVAHACADEAKPLRGRCRRAIYTQYTLDMFAFLTEDDRAVCQKYVDLLDNVTKPRSG